jgi:hypothetical protein
MKILKVTYVENGYFSVLYSNYNTEIIQDITAIKMQVPTDIYLKDILMFIRRMKLEKLADNEFDDLKYRNHMIVEDKTNEIEIKKLQRYLSAQMSAPSPTFDSGYLIKSLGIK